MSYQGQQERQVCFHHWQQGIITLFLCMSIIIWLSLLCTCTQPTPKQKNLVHQRIIEEHRTKDSSSIAEVNSASQGDLDVDMSDIVTKNTKTSSHITAPAMTPMYMCTTDQVLFHSFPDSNVSTIASSSPFLLYLSLSHLPQPHGHLLTV